MKNKNGIKCLEKPRTLGKDKKGKKKGKKSGLAPDIQGSVYSNWTLKKGLYAKLL